MCGIAGIVYHDRERPVSEALVRRMCTAIRHRGPDDEGLHVRGAVGLGMRRLSIIDLSGGRQPIFTEDGSKVIVFNGEIYNYRELRQGLLARGHTFRSSGDTETVLHLYEEQGVDWVTSLRGMFACAIWDDAAETLVLARDRFGIKPLYVVTAPWGIAFASELKALHAAGLTARVLDWEALDSFLQLGYVPAPRTPFRDVRKLEPGHTLVWHRGNGAPVARRYWQFPQQDRHGPAEPEARVVEWLDESVAAHLESDVPVAAFLSGGLDSSAVVASMALAGDAPHAFTARYAGSGAETADETDLARALAARHRADLTVVDIRPDLKNIFEPIVRALDEPHADDSAIPTWLLSQAVGSQYKVALTGIGGDELFAGYRRHLGLLVTGYYAKLPRRLRHLVAAASRWLPEPSDGTLGVDRLKRFLRTSNGSVPDRFLGMMSRLSNDERLALYAPSLRTHISGRAAGARFRDVFGAHGAVTGLAAGLYMDYTTFLPDDILALSDRLSMAHSLEVRVPFVDHRLIEAVFPIPQRVKIGTLPGWQGKRLLRRALRPRLPDAHFRAPKRGFVGPTAAWLRNELRPVLTDELSPARQRRLGYFDPATIATLLDQHLTGRQNQERILLALLCFSTWHRLYME